MWLVSTKINLPIKFKIRWIYLKSKYFPCQPMAQHICEQRGSNRDPIHKMSTFVEFWQPNARWNHDQLPLIDSVIKLLLIDFKPYNEQVLDYG